MVCRSDLRVSQQQSNPGKGVTMPTYEFTTEDVEYLRHGDKPLIARVYKPKGDGPFPAVVDLHGGAWTSGDLTGTHGLDETLAKNGFVVASLNFRHAADGYPTSMIEDRKSTRLNSSHTVSSYAVFCLKKKIIVDSPYLYGKVER